MTRRQRLALALVGGLAAFALAGPSCHPTLHIVSPAHQSPVESAGDVAVQIDLGTPLPPGARIRVALLAGVDAPPATTSDLTSRFDLAQAVLTATVATAELREGRNTLFVSLDRDGNGVVEATASSTFSFEPNLDLSNADHCDVLDPGHCLLPFPSDFFTVEDAASDTGRRVNFAPEAMPTNLFGVSIDPAEWNRNDGFSPGPMIMLQVPDVDLGLTGSAPITDIERSLDPDAPIVLVHAASGQRQLMWTELDAGSETPASDSLMVRPAVNLSDGERYIVALRRLRDSSGTLIEPGRAFRVLRDGIPSYRPAIEERRPHMQEILVELEAAGVERNDLYLAWDFTVISSRSLSERMLHMRDQAFASLAGGSPVFAVVDDDDGPAVEEHPRAELFRWVRGTYQVPLYTTHDGMPGARLTRADPDDPDSLPVQVGEYAAKFICIIPNAAVEETAEGLVAHPGRASLYGHGLLGSRSEARSSHNRAFANEYNFVSCATDWIGMAEDDFDHIIENIIGDFSQFPSLPDRMHQGFLNTLFLGRLMVHEDGFASHCAFQAVDWTPTPQEQCPVQGPPVFDRSELFYDGNSQGAIAGGGVTAFAQDWTRAVLGVPGMNYSTLLRRSVDFLDFNVFYSAFYPSRLEQQLGFAAAQMLWDRTDTNGHANHLTHDPYPGTPEHKILLQVAFGDHQVANVTAEAEARTIGAHIHQPALAPGRHTAVDPYFAIPPIEYPHDGSAIVIFDSGTPAPPLENVTPDPSASQDPHETPRRDPAGKLQKSEFLRSGGAIIDVCGGMPCTAVDP